MQPSHDHSLKALNTFGFDVKAEHFVRVSSLAELQAALAWAKLEAQPVFVLGGGSNTVFTRDVSGLVVQMNLQALEFASSDRSHATVVAGAGIDWHQLVEQCLSRQRYGLENLALIPGCAGAAPIQNIGAYGRELSEFLVGVETLNRSTGEVLTLPREQCRFGYRDSVFKSPAGRDLIVLGIQLRLATRDQPVWHYASLSQSLQQAGISAPSSHDVFTHVCAIRRSKLPDPAQIGNAGSFFKNPVVSDKQLRSLLQDYPGLPHYPQPDGQCKLAAGWLIEQAGWKGHRRDGVGVHADQALVLVNLGDGNGQQIAILAADIQRDIARKFDIELETEPRLH
jgi:UDP-N-acetylmuramate dehydrogenase